MKLGRPLASAETRKTYPRASLCVAGLSLWAACAVGQQASTQASSSPAGGAPQGQAEAVPGRTAAELPAPPSDDGRQPRSSDRRRAIKLYLESSKQYVNSEFEEAMLGFQRAATLDPSNNQYSMAAEVARSHAVTALVQAAAKDRLQGNDSAARASLQKALALDPNSFLVSQHLDELADSAIADERAPLYATAATAALGAGDVLAPATTQHSFHVRSDRRSAIQQVYRAYGVTAIVDDSVRPGAVKLDLDGATYAEAVHAVQLLTGTFTVTLDPHHAIVAADTPTNRQRLMRQDAETVYLGGMSDDEVTEVESLAKNVFNITQEKAIPSERTISLRAPQSTLDAFNGTVRALMDGKSQVILDVRMIQVAHTSARNTGLQLPQTMTAFNVAAEEASILSQNQALVQQIISSGLASPNDPLAILGILIAAGQVSGSLFANGFALFGGGLTQSALVPGATTFNLNINTSDSRELDQIQLRLEDGAEGTLKEGSRYPIQTSSFSSLSPSVPNIPGLTGAGLSSSLSSLLSSLGSAVPNIPMVQYQDLGLTLNATPRVLRSGNVALSLDLKLDALSGASIDGNPVLSTRSLKGVVTLREGEAAVVATEVDKSESHAISGTPGISEIPGMNDITDKNVQKNYATIVIVMTPHVVRGAQAAGHSAMMRVEKTGTQ